MGGNICNSIITRNCTLLPYSENWQQNRRDVDYILLNMTVETAFVMLASKLYVSTIIYSMCNTSTCLFVLQDLADDAIDEALKTAEAEPLRLAVLTAGDDVTGVFIVGDTCIIQLSSKDILSAVLLLTVSY